MRNLERAWSLRLFLGSIGGAALVVVACGSSTETPGGTGAGATGGGGAAGKGSGGRGAGVAGGGVSSGGVGGGAGSGTSAGSGGTSGSASNVAGSSGAVAGSGGVAGSAGRGASAGNAGSAASSGGEQSMAGEAGMPGVGGSAGAGGSAGSGLAGSGTAGSGMAGNGGSGGVVVGDCPSAPSPVGWATESGDGVAATTGGLGGDTVTPTSAAQLMEYAESTEPLVIRIQGSFSVPRLNVSSNKTLVGIGNDATINGGVRIRGYDDDMIRNVIIQNLHVNGGTTDVDNDAMQIYFAHHVWIDHCDIYDGLDGNLDITHASNWITISWTKFRYTSAYQRPSGEDSDHRFSNLLGHSDNNASEDTGRMKVSLHHNWYAEGVIERMPRVRFGQVHVFNNYYSSAANNYCVGGGYEAELLVQNNYFDNVKDPHRFQDDDDTAVIAANGNNYVGISDTTLKDTRGSAFTPGYSAALEPADAALKATVMKCAGPR